jgi:hypothetical protein
MGKSHMGKRRLKLNGDEQDAFSRWGRRFLCYINRVGVRAEIKTAYRRRERHQAKQDIREGKTDE